MLGRVGSRPPGLSTQHPHATLSDQLFSRWKRGEGMAEQTYAAHQIQTLFSCDNRLTTLVESMTSSFRTKMRNLLSPFLQFLLTVFTHCCLQTSAKLLSAAPDDCFVQAPVLGNFQRDGPLCIGRRNKCACNDGHANYMKIIQASASIRGVEEGERIDLARSASTLWAIKEDIPRSGCRAGADRKVKKHMRDMDHTEHRPFYDLLEPVDALS